MRSLSAEESALWARVTETIRPLSREPVATEPEPSPAPRPQPRPAAVAPRLAPPPVKPPPPPRIGQTLDGSWDRKLREGRVSPDRVIDLHGHSLDRAWGAIDRGLEQAIARGDRLVLLITGHARSGEPPLPRGRIRAAVHDWLAVSRHAARIAAVRGAHGRHGGGGSLYLVLRRT